MKKLLTKANGYTRTYYTFLNQYSGNRRIYSKDEKFFIEVSGKIVDVTNIRSAFYMDR